MDFMEQPDNVPDACFLPDYDGPYYMPIWAEKRQVHFQSDVGTNRATGDN